MDLFKQIESNLNPKSFVAKCLIRFGWMNEELIKQILPLRARSYMYSAYKGKRNIIMQSLYLSNNELMLTCDELMMQITEAKQHSGRD